MTYEKEVYNGSFGVYYKVLIYGINGTMIDKYTIELKDYSTVTELYPTDIKINGVSISNFKADKKSYTYYTKDLNNINIVPEFSKANVKYEVTVKDNVYTLNIFDENKYSVFTYKITAQDFGYTVIGDVTLMLNSISATKVGGSVALPKGTYRLKLAKGDIEFGYSKRVTDYCSVTLSDKYKGFITLDTTGGTYTFQFDTKTNKLIIKHDKNMPNEYLIGDIDTILKPVGDRPLSIGTQQLPKGTYKFKLSIGGQEYGYNKVVNDATSGSLSMNSKYTAQVTLNATGGMYTFVLNTETNKLIIRHTPIDDECTTDVHISGTFNLVLNDKSATGEDLTVATGTTYLEDGCPTFKVYNYGVAYTSGAIFNNKGKRTLSSQYTTPITLNATGGNYKFVFDKETGVFEVSLVE